MFTFANECSINCFGVCLLTTNTWPHAYFLVVKVVVGCSQRHIHILTHKLTHLCNVHRKCHAFPFVTGQGCGNPGSVTCNSTYSAWMKLATFEVASVFRYNPQDHLSLWKHVDSLAQLLHLWVVRHLPSLNILLLYNSILLSIFKLTKIFLLKV